MDDSFTDEPDYEDESDQQERAEEAAAPEVPAARNYITPAGLQRLRAELKFLLTRERPAVTEVVAWAAGNGDRSENADYHYGKKRLREIDRRIHYLTKRLDSAELVDPKQQKGDKIFFGATVELEDEAGARSTFVIVGEDEIDSSSGRISWRSPVGRALLGKRPGDVVTVRRPAGEIELEILAVRYV